MSSSPPGYPKTPTLDRVKAVQNESQAIGAFLEWLAEGRHITLAVRHAHSEAE